MEQAPAVWPIVCTGRATWAWSLLREQNPSCVLALRQAQKAPGGGEEEKREKEKGTLFPNPPLFLPSFSNSLSFQRSLRSLEPNNFIIIAGRLIH